MKYKIKKVRVEPADLAKGRMYFFVTGPTENFFANRGLPYRELRPLIVPILKRALKVSRFVDLTAKWSQYAGCSCPCSPGFIINLPYDVYVHVQEAK